MVSKLTEIQKPAYCSPIMVGLAHLLITRTVFYLKPGIRQAGETTGEVFRGQVAFEPRTDNVWGFPLLTTDQHMGRMPESGAVLVPTR